MSTRYINPYTDFGFKKIFGEEASKPLLIDFLNSLLPEHHQIAELNFKNTEQLGVVGDERKAVYDIYCENEQGEKFIVELQQAKQQHFKERTLFYTSYPIREQGIKGTWDYSLKAVYCIAILNFTFDDVQSSDVVHTVQLKNQHNQVFYDGLSLIFLEMPKFNKAEHELLSQLDKWLYFIKNLDELEQIPNIFKEDDIFDQAFIKAELAKLNGEDRHQYEQSLKQYRDFYAVMETRWEEGKAEGLIEGMEKGKHERDKELIERLRLQGYNAEQIGLLLGIDVSK